MSAVADIATSTRTFCVHTLKVWPDHYKALATGQKSFELRRDDRGYREGDYLLLCEFDPESQAFTGASLSRKVTNILRDFAGLQPGYVVMALRPRRLP